jgi:plasmid stabilization system protein ParE
MTKKLDEIYTYISGELASPAAATNTISKILDRLQILQQFPEAGPKLSALYARTPARYAETRYIVCGKHVVFYNYDENHVSILQIYHSTENYIRYIFEESF